MHIVSEFNMPPVVEGAEEAPPNQRQMGTTTREEALRLLGQLRDASQPGSRRQAGKGGGRRESRRWIPPETLMVELYDGESWQRVEALDCGVTGVRIMHLPGFVGDGTAVVRLTTPDSGAVLVTGDVMWHHPKTGTAGLQFTFQTDEDREAWFEGLVEALLSRHAMN